MISYVATLRQWCWRGVIFGFLAGHPGCTVSRARRRPGGPPPLRSRQHFFGLPSLSPALRKACDRGSELFLRTLDLATGVCSCRGYMLMENPEDPGRPPFPSFWITPQWLQAQKKFGLSLFSGDQCPRGAAVPKLLHPGRNKPKSGFSTSYAAIVSVVIHQWSGGTRSRRSSIPRHWLSILVRCVSCSRTRS